MSRRTITERIRRCKSDETRIEIIIQWLTDWQVEQTKLCEKLSHAVDIHDFDEACIVNGQLREITNKKFTALYNILREIGMSEQAKDGGQIYGWGKYQTGLVAIMGRHIANQKWDEIGIVADKLISANQTNFKGVKHIILTHQKANPFIPSAPNRHPEDQVPEPKLSSVSEIIETYTKTDSLKETAAICGVNWQKVRKILITEGKYENDESQMIVKLYRSGISTDEIAARLGMTAKAVNNYLPYTKGTYNSDYPTENAIAIRKHRTKESTL